MDEKQIEELNKAISKLSEEDQEQIAAGAKISDAQCKLLKPFLEVAPKTIVISYGCPLPHQQSTYPQLVQKEISKMNKIEEAKSLLNPEKKD